MTEASQRTRNAASITAAALAIPLIALAVQMVDSPSLRRFFGIDGPAGKAASTTPADRRPDTIVDPVQLHEDSGSAVTTQAPQAQSVEQANAANPPDEQAVSKDAPESSEPVAQPRMTRVDPPPVRKVLPPPIGIAERICRSKSITISASISDYFVQRLQSMSGTRSIDIVSCDPVTGRFSVANDADPAAGPTKGSAKAYSLSFEYRSRARPTDASHDWVICQIGATEVTEADTNGRMTCSSSHYLAEWPVQIGL